MVMLARSTRRLRDGKAGIRNTRHRHHGGHGVSRRIGSCAERRRHNRTVGDCVNLESAEERRDCYAARVDAAVQERERSTAAAPPDSPSSSPDADTAAPQSATRADPQRQPTDVVATITGLRETVPNSYLITLDNDQVWRQKEPKWFPLRVGQAVRIFPSSWGDTFRLSVQGLSGYLQVERVR